MVPRNAPINISGKEFEKIGHTLVTEISKFLESIPQKSVTTGNNRDEVQSLLTEDLLPENGTDPSLLIKNANHLLCNHSLLNGHPKFFGYITSSAAPIGAFGDLIAAAVNPNVGASILSPMATAIEEQTIKWITQLIGLPKSYGGLLVSGGNMANFTGFLAARTAKANGNFKEDGLQGQSMTIYCSKSTHTWIEKAAVLFGHGTNAIKWINTDSNNRMSLTHLEDAIKDDLKKGNTPFLVVGTAGDVSTGAVDNLAEIGAISKKYNLWFHIDGAYGVPATIVPEYKNFFKGIELADSMALDPHKWLYSPLEAGCTLVKNPRHLTDTFSSHPEYYNFDEGTHNFYEFGMQNSRGFRALKVWLAIQQVGKKGYEQMIRTDIELSKLMYILAEAHPNLEARSQNLSITTFRYIPEGYNAKDLNNKSYLNTLNEALNNKLQGAGEAFLSNAIIDGNYFLRACIVNFRTDRKDIEELIAIVVKYGKELHEKLQNSN